MPRRKACCFGASAERDLGTRLDMWRVPAILATEVDLASVRGIGDVVRDLGSRLDLTDKEELHVAMLRFGIGSNAPG